MGLEALKGSSLPNRSKYLYMLALGVSKMGFVLGSGNDPITSVDWPLAKESHMGPPKCTG